MKLVLETNLWARFKAFLSRRTRREACILSAELTIVLLMIGGAYFFGTFKPILRDFYIANYAHVRAGPRIPFEDNDDYFRGFKIDKGNIYTYGMESNNKWIAEYTRMIIPYMLYERVTPNPIFPRSAGSIPFPGVQSFHVAGRMLPRSNMILLNERYWLDEKWNDKRRALQTLVHELVHVQQGAYIMGSSAELEAATSTATTEVLAAMCNYQDQLACKAFWFHIENFARSSMLVQLSDMGLGEVYEWWANAFWRDNIETGSYYKAMRYWATQPGALIALRRKYELVPWQRIIDGLVDGVPLNTGHPVCSSETLMCKILGMPFDDTWYLLQGIVWSME